MLDKSELDDIALWPVSGYISLTVVYPVLLLE